MKIVGIYCSNGPINIKGDVLDNSKTIPKRSDTTKEAEIYICPTCGKVFSRKWLLSRHINVSHSESDCPCKACDKVFLTDLDLKKHCKIHENMCGICGFAFSESIDLKRSHMKTHAKYNCLLCTSTFTYPGGLKLHINAVHNYERPYSCPLCTMKFTRQDHYKRHLRTHTKERPFECEICLRKFAFRAHLTKHLRTHNQEEMKCKICFKKFKQRIQLTYHMKQVHQQKQ